MVLSGRPDEALSWADRAVAGTVEGSALRAMARTAQAYALACAGLSSEGLATLSFLPAPGTSPKEDPWVLPEVQGDDWPTPPVEVMRVQPAPTAPADSALPPTHLNVNTHWWD